MKKLLAVVVFVGLAAVVYAKVIRSSPAEAACDRLAELCGADVDVGECRSEMTDAEQLVGEKVVGKATECMRDADTCVEAAGCMAGAATHAIDDFEKGFKRARQH